MGSEAFQVVAGIYSSIKKQGDKQCYIIKQISRNWRFRPL